MAEGVRWSQSLDLTEIKKDNDQKSLSFFMAEGVRFELTYEFPHALFSRQAS